MRKNRTTGHRLLLYVVCFCGSTLGGQNAGRTGGARAETLASEMVAAHNRERARLAVNPLVWSDQLAEAAQSWADYLIAKGEFAPRRDHRYGENLFEVSGGSATPRQVVEAWISEEKSYDRRTNSCLATCGHYKQVMWRETRLVGCGVARDRRREVWVCNYDPLGNLAGERPY